MIDRIFNYLICGIASVIVFFFGIIIYRNARVSFNVFLMIVGIYVIGFIVYEVSKIIIKKLNL